MTPGERGRARAAREIEAAEAKPLQPIDDQAEREDRARRRAEARERFRAEGLMERPNTTWAGE